MQKQSITAFAILLSLIGGLLAVPVVLAVPVPSVSLDMPANVMIGADFTFTATFDNIAASDVGYGPFIDLIIPFDGNDGGNGTDTPDGIDFVDATYQGNPVDSFEFTFPASGCVQHPLLENTDETSREVCGTPGDKLVVLELPFGSYGPSQPPIEVDVNATMSSLADANVPLSISARGGFHLGADALNNPCCDLPVVSPNTSVPIRPTAVNINKTTPLTEEETVSGPNFEQEWAITVDLVEGQTVADLIITDYLPNNVVVVSGSVNVSLGAGVTATPTGGTVTLPAAMPANAPNNQLTVEFTSITGSDVENDVEITFNFYATDVDANGNDVLNPNSGGEAVLDNTADVQGSWTPDDFRDPASTDNLASGLCVTCTGNVAPFTKAIAAQKTLVSGGPVAAGATLRYRVNFQVSDYFTFDDLILTDVIADGQQFNPVFAPTFEIQERGTTYTGNFAVGTDLIVDTSQIGNDTNPATDGSTTLEFRLSDALIGAGDDGIVQGGRATPLDTNSAEGFIIYETIVQDTFTDTYPSGDASVDLGDTLTNQAEIDGQILDNNTLLATGYSRDDDQTEVEQDVERGSLTKVLFAINNTTCGTCQGEEILPGDEVTFIITQEFNSSDFENLILTDFLSLPVFDVTELTTFNYTVSGALPPAGTAQFYTGDTLYNLMVANGVTAGTRPVMTTDTVANSVSFDYGTFDDPTNTSTEINIVLTLTVQDTPYADELRLTNQAQSASGSTNSGNDDDNTSFQMISLQPILTTRKGIVATDNTNAQFTQTPSAPSGVTFNAPGSSVPFSGTISSNGLAANPVDSDLTQAEAGDTMTFALILENRGTSDNGAFDIVVQDSLPAGFIIPPGGLNLNISVGDGSPPPGGFIPLDGGDASDIFGSGIEIVDDVNRGACGPYHATDGSNILVITYDLMIDPTIAVPSVLTNGVQISNYSSIEAGRQYAFAQSLRQRDIARAAMVGASLLSNDDDDDDDSSSEDTTATTVASVQSQTTDLILDNSGFADWTITLDNTSGADYSDIEILATLADGLVAIDVTNTSGTVVINGQVITLTQDVLVVGDSITLTIRLQLDGNITDVNAFLSTLIIRGNGFETVATNMQLISNIATLPTTGQSRWSKWHDLVFRIIR